jgi:exodeoxyribonuclease V beta subunit
VQAALADAGVPAVVGGAGSVFATPAARDWLALLEALERPAAPSRARAAALTPLLGWSARDVALASEAQLEELHQRLFSWAHVLRARGMAALAETIALGERLPGRVLTERGGERRLTDLTHVAELLHRAAATGGLGVAALAGWLRQRIDAAADRERGDDELARRLESDAEARSSTARSCGSRAAFRGTPSRSTSTTPSRGTGARSMSGLAGTSTATTLPSTSARSAARSSGSPTWR